MISAEKPALDPNTVKMWTLSANDMDDGDVVSYGFCNVKRVIKHSLASLVGRERPTSHIVCHVTLYFLCLPSLVMSLLFPISLGPGGL